MDMLPYPMGFKADEDKKKRETEIEWARLNYIESKNCIALPPKLEDAEEDSKAGMVAPILTAFEKQKECDQMHIASFEENGDAQVRFRDVLFACVQRAYRAASEEDSAAFEIADEHKGILEDETKRMSKVPIK